MNGLEARGFFKPQIRRKQSWNEAFYHTQITYATRPFKFIWLFQQRRTVNAFILSTQYTWRHQVCGTFLPPCPQLPTVWFVSSLWSCTNS